MTPCRKRRERAHIWGPPIGLLSLRETWRPFCDFQTPDNLEPLHPNLGNAFKHRQKGVNEKATVKPQMGLVYPKVEGYD